MSDHIAFIDGNIAASNLVPAAWFNSANNLAYRGANAIYFTTTGSANAQVLTITGAAADFTSLPAGTSLTFKAGFTNTAAMTLQVVTAATNVAASVTTQGLAALLANQVLANGIYTVVWDGTEFQLQATPTAPVSTRQVFLSGSAATYTTPAGARQLRIRMKAAGAGGNGSGTAMGTVATAGGATIFNSIQAAGGGIPPNAGPYGGLGGTGGTGSASLRIPGAPGGIGIPVYVSATNVQIYGGPGGGNGGGNAASPNGAANSGGGGSGAAGSSVAFASASTWIVGGGGGEGEYVEIIINSPAATYTYTIGAVGVGGGAGTSGGAGGNGGTGWITVDEFY